LENVLAFAGSQDSAQEPEPTYQMIIPDDPKVRKESGVAEKHAGKPIKLHARRAGKTLGDYLTADEKPVQSQVKGGEKKILSVLAQYPEGCSRDQLTVLTGYTGNDGSQPAQ
jgi:hypothetical protein